LIFHNPVRVDRGKPDLSGVGQLVGGRAAALVTSEGSAKRGIVDRLTREIPLVARCAPTNNPTVESIQENAQAILSGSTRPEVIVALGGGSAMDTAKGIAAIASPGCSPQWLADHLRSGAPFPNAFAPPAIIAIPTTAGTGSEVTMWGTVWDERTGAKYSISHPRLYPEHALLIPELTLTVPLDLTLFTALDALSHCMESVWNKRSNAVSDAFASAGIARVIPAVGRVLSNPGDLDSRRDLQEGALLGGLAISVTATALAHSISYPLTSRHGVPHGLACGFTLPELVRFNGSAAPERIGVIARAMGTDGVAETSARLGDLFAEWEVPGRIRSFIDEQQAMAMKDSLLTPGRADNNVRAASHDDALRIVLSSL
jgi:alcohol dehydrogenase